MALSIGSPSERGTAELALRAASTAQAAASRRTVGQSSVREVKATRTALSSAEAASCLRQALTESTGKAPSAKTLAIVTAQWAHETAHGASMYNYNFGGIKGVGPSGMTVSQRTKEGWGASEVTIVDRFRAYQTPQEGARDYIGLLSARYPAAIAAATEGDPRGFVRALKSGGYFTGDARAYERSITQIAAQLGAPTSGATPEQRAAVSRETRTAALDSGESRSRPVGESLARSQFVAAMGPLIPRALVDDLQSRQNAFQPDYQAAGPDVLASGLGAVSALTMADEVARAALQIAYDDSRRRGNDGGQGRT